MNKVAEVLHAHQDAITSLVEAQGQIWSASRDGYIHVWAVHVRLPFIKEKENERKREREFGRRR